MAGILVNASFVRGKLLCRILRCQSAVQTNEHQPSLLHLKTRISHNNQTLFILIDFRGKEGVKNNMEFCSCFDNIMGCVAVAWGRPDSLASLQKQINSKYKIIFSTWAAFSAPQRRNLIKVSLACFLFFHFANCPISE